MVRKIFFISTIVAVCAAIILAYYVFNFSQKLQEAELAHRQTTDNLTATEAMLVSRSTENQQLNDQAAALTQQVSELESKLYQLTVELRTAQDELKTVQMETHDIIIDTRLDFDITQMVLTYYQALRDNDPDRFLSVTWYDSVEDAYDWQHREKWISNFPVKIEVQHIPHDSYIGIAVHLRDGGTDSLAATKHENQWLLVEAS